MQYKDPIPTTNAHEILPLSDLVRQRFVTFPESRFLLFADLLRPLTHGVRYLHYMVHILLGKHPEEHADLGI